MTEMKIEIHNPVSTESTAEAALAARLTAGCNCAHARVAEVRRLANAWIRNHERNPRVTDERIAAAGRMVLEALDGTDDA